jgi:hypothetical protein
MAAPQIYLSYSYFNDKYLAINPTSRTLPKLTISTPPKIFERIDFIYLPLVIHKLQRGPLN